MKNIAIAGGFLFLAANGAGILSIDNSKCCQGGSDTDAI